VRAQLKICTEADYLQAHLTVIEGGSRGRNSTLHNVSQRITSVLKAARRRPNARVKRIIEKAPSCHFGSNHKGRTIIPRSFRGCGVILAIYNYMKFL
jgi:hypothetical protein